MKGAVLHTSLLMRKNGEERDTVNGRDASRGCVVAFATSHRAIVDSRRSR